jgi:YVTN family beta-propeller protein
VAARFCERALRAGPVRAIRKYRNPETLPVCGQLPKHFCEESKQLPELRMMECSWGPVDCPKKSRRIATTKSPRTRTLLLLIAALTLFSSVARAQSFTVSVGTQSAPVAIAFNPVTGQIYVANNGSASVTVINSVTENSVATIPVGTNPNAIAINPVTNTIYVTNGGSGSVSVINGANNTVTATVTVGTSPRAVAVDPLANVVYVANGGSNNVSIINGATNGVTATTPVGTTPAAVAVNPQTHIAYVANSGSGNVSVIPGTSSTVSATITAGTNPVSIAVNQIGNVIYVANNGSNNATVINGANNSASTATDPNAVGPVAVAVNPVSGNAYVANNTSHNVTEIATGTNAITTILDPNATAPVAVAVNPTSNQIYVANGGSKNITVIAGGNNAVTTLNDPNANTPAAIAVNPLTHQIYAANSGSNSVSCFNVASNTTTTLTDATAVHPGAVAVNQVSQRVAVVNSNSNNITILFGSDLGQPSAIIQTVADPNAVHPVAIAGNTLTGQFYIANQTSNNVTVLSASGVTTTLSDANAHGPIAVAVNVVTNKIYVANSLSNNVTVINGASNAISTVSDPNAAGPAAIAVNPATGKVYVANSGSNNVSVFDPLLGTVQTISDPAASKSVALAVDVATNTVYVANFTSDNVSIFNGATNTLTATVDADLNPIALAVNELTDSIYVANSGRNNVTVINGATNTVAATVAAGTSPQAIGVDLATNQVYVANLGNGASDHGSITDIDGFSLTSVTFSDPNANGPTALVTDAATSQIYVANSVSGNITDAAEQNIQPNQIAVFITPSNLPGGDATANPPTFIYTGSSPGNETLDQVMAQIDTWTGSWFISQPTATAGQFTVTSQVLTPGLHFGYTFGTDGGEGTSNNTGAQSSPVIGNVGFAGFAEAPPIADFAPAVLAFGTQTTNTTSAPLTVTFGNTGGAPLTFSYGVTGSNAADFTQGASDTCSTLGGQLAANATCVAALVFKPSTNGSETATLTFTDNSNSVSGSTQTVQIIGSGSSVPTFTLSVGQAGSGVGSVSSSPAGITCQPTCSAAFNQGTQVTLTASPSAGSTFTGWSGACSGTGSCVVAMNSSQSVTATFTLTGSTTCVASGAAIWIGGASGSWNTASNWSTQSVPNSATASVCINDGNATPSAVTVNSGVSVGNLVIDHGSSLTIANNVDFQVNGNVYNAGQIVINSAANGTDLSFIGQATLSGGGTVTMANVNAAVREDAASATLTNVNNTFVGAGQIGTNGLTFINQAAGTVNATLGLTLQVNSAGTRNTGLLEATSGDLLITVAVNNASGTISAKTGGAVQMSNGADIQGGTLTADSASGTFLGTVSSTVLLDGSTSGPLVITGTYTLVNNTDTQAQGTITNNGVIAIAAAGNGTALSVLGSLTLNGGGAVTMSNPNAEIREDSANSTLINVNNTIEGVGQIGNNGLSFTNRSAGVVTANTPSATLLLNASNVINQGLLEAQAGGLLLIDVTVNNFQANITADGANSQVQFTNGARIEGGTLNEINGAQFLGTVASTVVLDGSTQGPLTNAASYVLTNNSDTQLIGTINNTNSFQIQSQANGTALSMIGAVTLTGGGTVTLANNNAEVRLDQAGSTLTNVNNTISGAGQIGNNGLTFINQPGGVVNANTSAGQLVVNSSGTVNQGLFEASSSGVLEIDVTVTNAGGLISAQSGSQVQLLSGARIAGGTLTSGTGANTFFGTVSSTVILDGATQGTLNNQAFYTLDNNSDTQILGTINNTGTFLINSAANGTALSVVGAVTLTGGGTITLGNVNAQLRSDLGGSSLTNINNTIQGAGQVGNQGLSMMNSPGGVIDANVSGVTMQFEASNAVNQGLLEASAGGILLVEVSMVNQNANLTASGAGSAVQLTNGARIEGGTMSTLNGATAFGTVASTVVLDGSTHGPLTNAAIYTINNNSDTQFLGTIINTNSFIINSAANGTALSALGAVTFTGGGTITMANVNAELRQDGGGSTFTNVNNTIAGAGQVGNNGLTFINQAAGTINANNTGAPLLFNPSFGQNQGLIEATQGGTLQIDVPFNDASGTISAGAGSSVQLSSGADVEGGTITSAAGATFFGTTSSTVVLDGSTHGALTNQAAYVLNNNTDTQILGTINNSGSITIAGAANGTALSLIGPTTLNGSGTVTMGNANSIIRQDAGSTSLTNAGNSITGPGQFTEPVYSQTAGFIQIPAGVADTVASFTISGGNAQIDGALTSSSGVVTSGTGIVSGTGALASAVQNGGIFEPGDIPAAGQLTIGSGSPYTQSAAGSYEVAIGGTTAGSQYSLLSISNAATLSGALNIRLVNGFTPALGNSFTILTASQGVSGTFATINSPSLPQGLNWSVAYNSTTVVLSVAQGSPATSALTISGGGSGSGTVSDDLGQINCTVTSGVTSGACNGNYQSGTVAILTATPAAGSTFTSWSTCAGTSPCSVTVTGTTVEHVVFNAVAPTFSISVKELGTGTGLVTDNLGEINCGEESGIGSGTCTATYASGTQVILSENTTAPATFGGWGNACVSSGTATTCTVTVSSALVVSANFVSAPVSIPLTFNPGTNVTQLAPFNCPSNPNPTPANPCTDANAHALQLAIPTVSTGFTVTVTATEVPPAQADGLCEVGNTVSNDFDCRFSTFFNFGTDANNNTITPLCYPYANGNCVHYAVYSGTPGTEPPVSDYSGGVNWKITWNNDTFTPPTLYTGSTPQLYDDPDYAATPTSAVGSVCGQPMTINGVAQNYSCQFEFDITTFFDATEPVDAGIGGTTKQLNDVVVAFPPNNTGELMVTSAPDAATVNAGSPIGITIGVSNPGPGVAGSVSLNDPLPSGTGINWAISPSFTGPGTCSIGGTVGSQVLTCSFGSFEVGANASVHVTSGSSSTGTFVNAATITTGNQQLLTIVTVSVQPVAAVFSNLTPSQSISAGTPSVIVLGTVSGSGGVVPAIGETVTVTINGASHSSTTGQSGAFIVTFPTANIPASATPYTITYSYAGDTNLTSATNTSTTLTVNAVVGNVTLNVTEMGTGTGAVTDNSGQINCSEANGIVTGTCSASYPTGTQVLLTATPTAPSTFGGWTNACASNGTGTSCGLTLTASVTATANFLPPPQMVNFTFTPGTNVAQQGVFDCVTNPNPTPSNPCTDANAHTLQLQLPQVNTQFALTLLATEVPPNQGTGLCKSGDTVLNDFNCRFTTFFNYGPDGNGNTVVPLCYPYANGNCVHYAVYSGTPGTEPDPSFYTGPVAWNITWNNDTFVPTGFWAGSTPQLYDDPDYAATPTSAVGSVCTQPMTINGVAQSYSCQFEFDITTFFNPTAPVDAGIGGTTKQLNDVVVAFPPTNTGAGQLAGTSTSASTAPGSPISFTVAVSNAGPGTENGVTLNDPLPDVSNALWTISPAYTGPGTCSIGGAAGAQTLTCSFGNLAAGAKFSVSVTNPTANAGSYTNTATISAANQQVLSISSATIQAFAAAFSALTPSQSIQFGKASAALSGVISAPGPLFPPTSESVSVTINGTTQSAPIGANGAFSLTFPTATIPGSATPYAIKYSYAGDSQFAAATNTSTTLTVTPATQTITLTGGPATAAFGSTFAVSATATSGLTVTITASGSCTLSGGAGTGTVTMTSGTGNCVVAANQAGNSNFAAAPQVTSSTAAQKASSTAVISSNSPNPSTSGQAVAVGVKVTGTGGTPTGSVAVTASTGEGCNATLASGAGTCSITFATTGARILTAVYSGDGNFSTSTSAGVTQTVNPATASTLKISPASVNFGNVYVGLLGIQFVTLTNSGTTPIAINKIAISGTGETPKEFFAVPLCPSSLAPKFSCAVLLTFIPSRDQTTTQTASLVVTDSAPGSPQSVPLSGTPINPQGSVNPFALNFGTQKAGTVSAAQTITLENTGTTPLTLGSISVSGSFSIAAGTTCTKGGVLNPSSTCVINVAFAPKTKGKTSGTVVINDNALLSPQFAVLSGTGD